MNGTISLQGSGRKLAKILAVINILSISAMRMRFGLSLYLRIIRLTPRPNGYIKRHGSGSNVFKSSSPSRTISIIAPKGMRDFFFFVDLVFVLAMCLIFFIFAVCN